MITKQDQLSILITFVIGLVAGGYFYLTGYTFKLSDVSKEDTYSDFAVVGEAYGNCRAEGCLSFQLLSNGTYRILINKSGIGQITKEGVITSDLRRELTKNITTDSLKLQSKSVPSHSCASAESGVDYKFKITRAGTEYDLDTCKTDIDYNSKSWTSLAKLWNYFETLE